MLIDGELVGGNGVVEVVNPATGQVFERAPRADAELLERAVQAAHRAFPAWSAKPIAERQAALRALGDALEPRVDEFARLLTTEQGKPFGQAQFEVGGAVYALKAYAELDLPMETLRENEKERIVIHHAPLGVVAAITPWNFPLMLGINKVAPALLAGNTLILKPAPTTPLTTLLFGELAKDIVPAGVLNVIVDQNDLGAALTSHPLVRKVSF